MSEKMVATTTNLKELVKAISDAEVLVSDLTQGFSFSEVTELIALATDLPAAIKDANLIFPEFKALDDAARSDLTAYVVAHCKFPANIAVEVWIEKVLTSIIMLSGIFSVPK